MAKEIEKPLKWHKSPDSTVSQDNIENDNLVSQFSLRKNQIALCTLNAKYIHASLGLRYLYSNLGALKPAANIHEFTINQRPIDIAEKLLATDPQVVGFGIYIWNVQQTEAVISLIKKIRPDTTIVIGGPEVSYEYKDSRAFELCDYLITGQADFAFRDLCTALLANKAPPGKVVDATAPQIRELVLPYEQYTVEDLANRVIYVEASRGCPFKCEFCLSALDKTAYPFDLDEFLQALADLYERGARQFKFVDRTFNLKVASCLRILDFFLERLSDDLFLHFEVIPDKLPATLRTKLTRFPGLSLQFEIGVQSFNPEVQATINRKQDNQKTRENIAWLRNNTNAYIHADLIFGLPGETLDSFADGFNDLIGLNPQEIQVGILKRLRGTGIDRHSTEFAMCYETDPPYALLKSRDIDFPTMQRMQRFARYWDMIGNSGRFTTTRPLVLGSSPFDHFLRLSDWLYRTTDQTSRISLARLFQLIYLGAKELNLCTEAELIDALETDFAHCGEKGRPPWEKFTKSQGETARTSSTKTRQPTFQTRGVAPTHKAPMARQARSRSSQP